MNAKRRYRLRVIGTKHDYIRRYKVIDTTTGARTDGVPGGLVKDEAQQFADDLNGIDPKADDETGEDDDR